MQLPNRGDRGPEMLRARRHSVSAHAQLSGHHEPGHSADRRFSDHIVKSTPRRPSTLLVETMSNDLSSVLPVSQRMSSSSSGTTATQDIQATKAGKRQASKQRQGSKQASQRRGSGVPSTVPRRGSSSSPTPGSVSNEVMDFNLSLQIAEIDRKLEKLSRQILEYHTSVSYTSSGPDAPGRPLSDPLGTSLAPPGDPVVVPMTGQLKAQVAWCTPVPNPPPTIHGLPGCPAQEAVDAPPETDMQNLVLPSNLDPEGSLASAQSFGAVGSLASWPETSMSSLMTREADKSLACTSVDSDASELDTNIGSQSVQFDHDAADYGSSDDSSAGMRGSGGLSDALCAGWAVPSRCPWLMDKSVEIRFMMDDPESSQTGKWYSILMPFFIFMSVLPTMMQTTDDPAFRTSQFAAMEVFAETVFLVDALIRLLVSPSPRIFFGEGFHNFIDVLVPMPLILRAFYGFQPDSSELDNFPGSALLYIVPLLRLLKTLRGFRKFNLILTVAAEVYVDTIPAMFMMAYIILVFATIFYYVEPRDNIPYYSNALWFCCVTITTVGYGDITPSTSLGYAVGFAMVCCSTFVMALPLGIIGTAVSEIWKDRDTIILRNWAKDRLDQLGYQASDMQRFFKAFDHDCDGSLNFNEFCEMVGQMTVGITPDRIRTLFRDFDEDGSGHVDAEEFVLKLYPSQYEELYPAVRRGSMRKSVTSYKC